MQQSARVVTPLAGTGAGEEGLRSASGAPTVRLLITDVTLLLEFGMNSSQQAQTNFLRAQGLVSLLEFNSSCTLDDLTPEATAKVLGIPLADAGLVVEFVTTAKKMPSSHSEYCRLIRASSPLRNVRGLSNEEIAAEISSIEQAARMPTSDAFGQLLEQISPKAANRLVELLKCRATPTDNLEAVTASREAWINMIEDIVEDRRVTGGSVVIGETMSIRKTGA